MKNTPYREIIGSLMWATVPTRPGIIFSVSLSSQFTENPHKFLENRNGDFLVSPMLIGLDSWIDGQVRAIRLLSVVEGDIERRVLDEICCRSFRCADHNSSHGAPLRQGLSCLSCLQWCFPAMGGRRSHDHLRCRGRGGPVCEGSSSSAMLRGRRRRVERWACGGDYRGLGGRR